MVNKLSSEDYKSLEEIINITNTIDKIYQELYDLDINSKKNTPKYTECINRLNSFLFEEKELYRSIKLDNDKCIGLSEYLLQSYNLDKLKSNIETYALHNYEERILRRILFRLNGYIKYDNKFLNIKISRRMLKRGITSANIAEQFNKNKEIKTYFESDLLNVFISILEETIEEKKNEPVRKKLIGTKYNIAFINSYFEHDMLADSFDVFPSVYINTKWIVEMLKITPEVYNMYKNMYGTDIVDYEVEELYRIKDVDYKDNDVLETALIRATFLRASLILLDDTIIHELKIVCKRDMETAEEKISLLLINEALDKANKDKEKVKIISLTN